MTDPAEFAVTIVDGYVDEPAHFGVPPYVSTYPRYVAGALVDAGVPSEAITDTRSTGCATTIAVGVMSSPRI
jgi:radical SAM superfamily enzyme with C-terminal helix-hairpin-helix motif